jgi:hypothetical protein
VEVILRFATLRPAAGHEAALSLASDSNFQRELRDAIATGGEPERVGEVARQFAETDFLHEADQVQRGVPLLALLERLRVGPLPSGDELASMARDAVDGESTEAFAGDLARVRDSVLARYLLPDGPDADIAEDLVRAYSLVSYVLSGFADRVATQAMLQGALALPEFLVRSQQPPAPPEPLPEDVARDLAEQIDVLAARHDRLTAAADELAYHAEDELDLSEVGDRTPLADLYLSIRGREITERSGEGARRKEASGDRSADLPVSSLLRASVGRNVVLSRRALSLVPETVLETVRSLDLDPDAATIGDIDASLVRARGETGQQLRTLSGHLAHVIGSYHVQPVIISPRWRRDPVDAPETPPPLATAAPTTHTEVRPLGVADLLLVRAQISHYQRSEVAAVENVLASERLTHTLRQLDSSETTITDEKELTDLWSQTQTVAEQENGRTTVQAVGPGVGPLAAEGPSSFAKAVTDQVSSTSSSRTRRHAVERRLRETEETVEHLLDNSDGQSGLYGVYQWLDKTYEARTFSYGSRLLYDIVVPEPAAVFREAIARPRGGLPLPVRPAPFKVSPEDLTVDNWAYYATGHHATGVEAPPPAQAVVTEPFAKQAKDPFADDAPTNTLTMAEARSTRLPKGYKATKFRVVVLASGYASGVVSVSIGTKSVVIGGANGVYVRSGRLDGERETIPVAVDVTSNGVDWGVSDVAVGVEIVCEATDELVSAWQVKTHAQILDANRRRFDEYAEAVATRDATARLVLQGLPKSRKATIVHTEVKRAALGYLTGQSFAGFNATSVDAAGFPYPNGAATSALAAYIRFFEQAVEWDHLAYAFFPYFWGSQPSWVSKLLTNEPDQRFASFLTSGAARVVLPIRLGYESAFERFLHTGAVPTTDELLDVGSALWVSLVDELRSQASPEGEETPVGEPWQFRIATDLVRARTDRSMPRWTLNQGTWQDAADPAF